MTLSKEIERTTLEEHKKANAGNSGNHYYYKQLSYKALHTVDQLEARINMVQNRIIELRDELIQDDPHEGACEATCAAPPLHWLIERLNSILETQAS